MSEMNSRLDDFLRRLSLLGASDLECELFAANWPEIPDARRTMLRGLSDPSLASIIVAARDSDDYGNGWLSR